MTLAREPAELWAVVAPSGITATFDAEAQARVHVASFDPDIRERLEVARYVREEAGPGRRGAKTEAGIPTDSVVLSAASGAVVANTCSEPYSCKVQRDGRLRPAGPPTTPQGDRGSSRASYGPRRTWVTSPRALGRARKRETEGLFLFGWPRRRLGLASKRSGEVRHAHWIAGPNEEEIGLPPWRYHNGQARAGVKGRRTNQQSAARNLGAQHPDRGPHSRQDLIHETRALLREHPRLARHARAPNQLFWRWSAPSDDLFGEQVDLLLVEPKDQRPIADNNRVISDQPLRVVRPRLFQGLDQLGADHHIGHADRRLSRPQRRNDSTRLGDG